jgi:hypothetical protein
MPNMLDYLKDNGGVDLNTMPLNDVDQLILAQMIYSDFNCDFAWPEKPIALKEALPTLGLMTDGVESLDRRFAFQHDDDEKLVHLLMESPRFSSMRLIGYVNKLEVEREMQFAAVALLVGDGTALIAYRGTDDTLIGWKEDCNMAFVAPVPSQTEALAFLTRIAGQTPLPLRLCGHSKGGNLSVYAATFCDDAIRARIREVVSFDGPGLRGIDADTTGYQKIDDRVRVIMPRSSIVGLLFSQRARITYIHSEKPGLLQHYPYYWQTEGTAFVLAENPTINGAYTSETARGFIEGLTMEERETFVEAIYTIAQSTKSDTWPEILKDWRRNTIRVVKALHGIDLKTAKLFTRVLRIFIRAAVDAVNIHAFDDAQVGGSILRYKLSKGTQLQIPSRRRKSHAISPLKG